MSRSEVIFSTHVRNYVMISESNEASGHLWGGGGVTLSVLEHSRASARSVIESLSVVGFSVFPRHLKLIVELSKFIEFRDAME